MIALWHRVLCTCIAAQLELCTALQRSLSFALHCSAASITTVCLLQPMSAGSALASTPHLGAPQLQCAGGGDPPQLHPLSQQQPLWQSTCMVESIGWPLEWLQVEEIHLNYTRFPPKEMPTWLLFNVLLAVAHPVILRWRRSTSTAPRLLDKGTSANNHSD